MTLLLSLLVNSWLPYLSLNGDISNNYGSILGPILSADPFDAIRHMSLSLYGSGASTSAASAHPILGPIFTSYNAGAIHLLAPLNHVVLGEVNTPDEAFYNGWNPCEAARSLHLVHCSNNSPLDHHIWVICKLAEVNVFYGIFFDFHTSTNMTLILLVYFYISPLLALALGFVH